MLLPYSPRRRRQALVAVILGLGVLLCHFLLERKSSYEDKVNIACAEALVRLEQHSVVWPGKSVLKGAEGSDVSESIALLSDYEMCVLRNRKLGKQQIKAIDSKLFPYINLDALRVGSNNLWPVRVRWNGNLLRDSVPKFASSGDYKYLGAAKIKYDSGLSFWGNWLNILSRTGPRGIVIAAGQGQVLDSIKLIKVLRHQKNSLPIEIIHRGDLLTEQQEKLIEAARGAPSGDYPAQELWFVNVTSILNPDYADRFTTYSNKWLAIIFSSFVDPILVDADTISFIPLENYYETRQHKETGSLFFRDREIISDLFNEPEINTLRKVVSNTLGLDLEVDDLAKEIDSHIKEPVVAQAARRLLLYGQKHHMESGLVLMNKNLHLTNLLAAVSLQFSSISEYFHGDKEWFWIAPLLRNATFSFHPKAASNVGKLGKIDQGDGKDFYQICSVQVSHTDEDGSLLWVNGGLRTCKKDSWTSDYNSNQRISSMFESDDEVRKYYQSPSILEGAIIPTVEKAQWIYTGECASFTYCTLYKEGEYGELMKFSDSQRKSYQEVVKVWNFK